MNFGADRPRVVFQDQLLQEKAQLEMTCSMTNSFSRSAAKRRCQTRNRSGTAAVETAVTLPLLAVLVFGSIESANAIFTRQSLEVAGYEVAREVTRPGATPTLAATRAQEVLSARGINNYELQITPTITAATARGTEVSVLVRTNATGIGIGPLRFFKDKTLEAQTFMVRL